jgi:hypothetical protein
MVVRLEITVPDGQAADVANELAGRYLDVERYPGATSAVVVVFTDAEARRDRVIAQAAAYFLREPP